MQDTIHCPSCGCEITVTETLTAQIRQNVRQELDAEVRRKDGDLTKRLDEIRHREKALEDSHAAIEKEIAGRVAHEQDRLAQEAKVRAQESVAAELRDIQDQLTTAKTQLTDVQKTELQLRKERRKLEEEKHALELTVNRTLDEERDKIRDNAKRESDESHRLKDADKEKMIGDLRHQIDELKRKSEQGSQQAQGEVLELMLEDSLRQYFPQDSIEDGSCWRAWRGCASRRFRRDGRRMRQDPLGIQANQSMARRLVAKAARRPACCQSPPSDHCHDRNAKRAQPVRLYRRRMDHETRMLARSGTRTAFGIA